MNKNYHFRNFEYLIYDAVHLLYIANDTNAAQDPFGYRFTYIRSSILNSVLLFECAANCCIESLILSPEERDDIDWWPFLKKYKHFLGSVNNKAKFDSNCEEVQAVVELKSVRDGLVHPKVRKASNPQRDELCDVDFGTFGKTKHLKIPKNPQQWRGNHAVAALKATNDFFNLFFLSWCGYNSSTVCEILLSPEPAMIPAPAYVFTDARGELDRARDEWKIDFKFIGKE